MDIIEWFMMDFKYLWLWKEQDLEKVKDVWGTNLFNYIYEHFNVSNWKKIPLIFLSLCFSSTLSSTLNKLVLSFAIRNLKGFRSLLLSQSCKNRTSSVYFVDVHVDIDKREIINFNVSLIQFLLNSLGIKSEQNRTHI